MDEYIGIIKMFAGNYAPTGWAFCDGQLLNISQHSPLFAVIGTTYGGDGISTFALPDLRGRFPLGAGQGRDLTFRALGELHGAEKVTLLTTEMPAHNHIVSNNSHTVVVKSSPDGTGERVLSVNTNENTNVNANHMIGQSSVTGQNLPHYNMPPYLGINYIIALEGMFPVRS